GSAGWANQGLSRAHGRAAGPGRPDVQGRQRHTRSPPGSCPRHRRRCCRRSGVQAVTRRSLRKDAAMRSKFGLLLLATAVAGCSYTPHDLPDRGVEAVNVPVVTRADYVFDAAAPRGSLAPSEKARLDAWFRGLSLSYGDAIYVDAPYAEGARYDVAQVAGNYGMMLEPGAPVTAGAGPSGMV